MSASSVSSKKALNAILSTNSRPKIISAERRLPNSICRCCHFNNFASTSAIPLSSPPSTPSSSSSSSSSSSAKNPSRRQRNSIPSTKNFSTSCPKSSAWPIGAAAAAEESNDSQQSSYSPATSSPTSTTITSSRARAGPALEDTPPPSLGKSDAKSNSSKGKENASSTNLPSPPRQKTIMYLNKMKQQGTPITMLTAFDYPTSLSIRSADIDICLIGDSLANVCLGYSTTQSLSLEAMIHHCQSVQRGLSSPLFSIPNFNQDGNSSHSNYAKPLVIADLPFGTFMTLEEGIKNSVKLIQQGGVDGLKIEGGEECLPLIKKLTDFGIPVMSHLGLQPQKVAATSGYRVQAKTTKSAFELLKEAKNAQENGAFAILLECIPTKVAKLVSENLEIPTIGIGAGRFTDGQVLVISDMLGELTSPHHVLAGLKTSEVYSSSPSRGNKENHSKAPTPSENSPLPPKFVRSFVRNSGTSLGALRIQAVRDYVDAVRDRSFPNDDESYKIEKKEWEGLLDLVQREMESEKS